MTRTTTHEPRLARLVPAVTVLALAGCASLLDIPQLEAPPAGAGDGGTDGEAGPACSAAEVTTLTSTPRGVHTAVDETDVYFTRLDPSTDSAILRCSKCGCAQPTELVTKLNQPGGIAVDDTYVFWTDAATLTGSLNRIEKNDPSKRQTLPGQESPLGVAVDAEFVYWTAVGGGPDPLAKSGVYRARKADFGEVTRLASSETFPDDIIPYALAVDDTHVYYTIASDIRENQADPCVAENGRVFGTIRRVDKRGGALQKSVVVASGQACPVAIALGEDSVYWANLGAGSALAGEVRSAAKTGGADKLLAGGLGRPTSIAFHAGRLTWNLPASFRIDSCTPPSCSDVGSIARSQVNPSGLSADSTGIYWASLGDIARSFADGALRRAPPLPAAK